MFSRDVDGKETREFLDACIFGVKNKNQQDASIYHPSISLPKLSLKKFHTYIGIEEI